MAAIWNRFEYDGSTVINSGSMNQVPILAAWGNVNSNAGYSVSLNPGDVWQAKMTYDVQGQGLITSIGTVTYLPALTPLATWLVSNGFYSSTDPQSDPNGDGVTLLMAYALNLDPKLNLASSLPKPVITGNQMNLTFYAGSAGVTYSVESSTDLKTWSTTGVTLSAPDANQFRTASVPTTDPHRYLRLVVVAP